MLAVSFATATAAVGLVAGLAAGFSAAGFAAGGLCGSRRFRRGRLRALEHRRICRRGPLPEYLSHWDARRRPMAFLPQQVLALQRLPQQADSPRRPAQQAFPQSVQVRQAMSQIPLFPWAQRRPLCYLSFVPPPGFRRPTSFSCLTFQSPCTAVGAYTTASLHGGAFRMGCPSQIGTSITGPSQASIEACECMLDEGFVTFFTKYPML